MHLNLSLGSRLLMAGLLVSLSQDRWQLAAALTLMGCFAAIYHPVGMSWLVRTAANRGSMT